MFRPITEYVEGDVCVNCWGPGKTFNDVPTPKRIYITGSGFAGACAPCNDTFIATQNPGIACQWRFDNGVVRGDWTPGPALTLFHFEIVGGPECYAQVGGLCALVSTFAGATMTISIDEPPTPEYKIAFDHNFSPDRKTVFIDYGVVNGEKVLRLSNRFHRVNVLAKYNPAY